MSKAEELLEALNQLVSAAVDLEYPPFAKTPLDMLPYEHRFRIAVSRLPNEAMSQIADHIIALESELSRLRPVVEAARRVVGAAALHGRRAYAIVDLRTALDALDAAEKGGRHEG